MLKLSFLRQSYSLVNQKKKHYYAHVKVQNIHILVFTSDPWVQMHRVYKKNSSNTFRKKKTHITLKFTLYDHDIFLNLKMWYKVTVGGGWYYEQILNHLFPFRGCSYKLYTVPYDRSYKRMVREEYTTKCGPWSWKSCVKTRWVIMSKNRLNCTFIPFMVSWMSDMVQN